MLSLGVQSLIFYCLSGKALVLVRVLREGLEVEDVSFQADLVVTVGGPV